MRCCSRWRGMPLTDHGQRRTVFSDNIIGLNKQARGLRQPEGIESALHPTFRRLVSITDVEISIAYRSGFDVARFDFRLRPDELAT